MSILIAEDTRVAAKLLEMLLASMGHETVTVTSGEAALEQLRARDDVELLITDLRMPGMDGVELIRTIKATKELAELPILVVTAVSDLSGVKQLAVLGVSYYLLKPVDRAQLERNVQLALAERELKLVSADEVSAKLGLDAAMYAALAASFADLVDDSLRILAERAELDVVPEGLDLGGLEEAATMFDVARLQTLVTPLLEARAAGGKPDGVRADLDRLSVLLRGLGRVLRRGVPQGSGAAEDHRADVATADAATTQ